MGLIEFDEFDAEIKLLISFRPVTLRVKVDNTPFLFVVKEVIDETVPF